MVDQIWRHPVKSLGAEQLSSSYIEKDRTFPGDRVWALTYENSRFDPLNPDWAPSQVFLRCSIAPLFAAVSTTILDHDGTIEFRHPNLKTIRVNLERDLERRKFIDWVRPICPKNAPQPVSLCRVPGRGMTDTEYPSISLNSISSLNDLSLKLGVKLHPRRFRGNIWVSGLDPWVELDLVGDQITVGDVKLEVIEPIERCNTTKTNENTGVRDVDTLSALQKNFGHKNFGVYCRVISSGFVNRGDLVL